MAEGKNDRPGHASGGKESDALAINERGQIIGTSWANDSADQHGFVWQNGKITDLDRLSPVAINERGQVIAERAGHAFLWQNGKITALGSLGGRTSHAVAIDEHGQVVGFSTTRSGATHAFIWQSGKMSDLGTLPGQTESKAVALTEHNQIVGESNAANPPFASSNARHAVLWTLKTGS